MKFSNKLLCLAVMLMMLCTLFTGAHAAAVTQIVEAGGTRYYDANGQLVTGATGLSKDGAVVKVSKTVEETGVENEFVVTMQVQTIEDIRVISSTNPDAAVQLVFDVSNSMDDCLYCGQEESSNSHVMYTCPDGRISAGFNYNNRCVTCNNRRSYHIASASTIAWNANSPAASHGYKSRLLDAKSAAIQFMNDFRDTATDGAKRYVSIITFGSSAVNIIGYNNDNSDWIDISTTEGYNRVVNLINGIKVANSDYDDYNGGGTNIEGGLQLGYNVWQAGLRTGGTINGIEYQYTVLLTDGTPTFNVSSSDNTRNSVDAIKGRQGGGNSTTENDAEDVGTIAGRIRAQSSIAKLYSICFGKDIENSRSVDVFNETPFGNWGNANPETTDRMTIGEWLGAFSTAAYNGSATNLFDAFQDVMNIIKLESKAWKVEDWMGDHIVYDGPVTVTSGSGSLYNHIITPDAADYPNGTPAYVWDLLSSNPDPALTNMKTENNVTTGVLGYTYKYEVTLDNLHADYTQGADALVNEKATLKYVVTNDDGTWPDADDASSIKTVEFERPEVKGLVGTLKFKKVDENGNPLAGAQFRVTPKDDPINHGDRWTHAVSNMTGADGVVTISGLPSGHDYVMEEIHVPSGYLNPGEKTVEVDWGTASVTGLNKVDDMQVLVNVEQSSAQLTIQKEFDNGSVIPAEITIKVTGKDSDFADQVILNRANRWTETIEGMPFGTYIVQEMYALDERGQNLNEDHGLIYEIWVDGEKKADAEYIDPANDPAPKVEITLEKISDTVDTVANVKFVNNIIPRMGEMTINKTFITVPADIYNNLSVTVEAVRIGADNQPLTGDKAYTAKLTLSAPSWSNTVELPIGRYLLTETITGNTPGYTYTSSGYKVNGVEAAHDIVEVKEKLGDNGTVLTVDLLNGYTRDMGHFHVSKFFDGLTEEQVQTLFAGKSIIVYVYSDAECTNVVDTLVLKADTDWEDVSITLPTGDYYLKEVVAEGENGSAYLPGYDLEDSWPDETNVGKITVVKDDSAHHAPTLRLMNIYTQHTGSLTVSKQFGTNADSQTVKAEEFGANGRSITVRILQGETEIDKVELNDANDFTVTLTDLPVGDYELEEVTTRTPSQGAHTAYVEDYALTASWDNKTVTIVKNGNASATVTNTYEHEMGELTITKAFAADSDLDADDFADRRFEMHVHKLNADGSKGDLERTIRLHRENQWTATVGLPVGEYYIGEEQREGMSHTALTPFYTLTVTGEGKQTITVGQTTNATITNKYTRDAGSLTVEKVFAGDLDKTYFEGRTINVEVLDGTTVVETLALNKDNNWTATVTDLLAGDYTLREVTAEGADNTAYEKGYILSAEWTDGNTVQVLKNVPAEKTVTNTYTENKGTLIIGKEFAGDLTASDFTGKVIKFEVFEKGGTEAVATVEVTSPDWKTSVKLPVGEYTVKEVSGSGDVETYSYVASWKNGDDTVFIIKDRSDEVTMVNTYTKDKGHLIISKAFGSNPDSQNVKNGVFGANGRSIAVRILQGETVVKTVLLNHANNFTVTVEDLAVGSYELEEVTARTDIYTASVPNYALTASWDNKTVTLTKNNTAHATVTNTYEHEMGELTITKAFAADSELDADDFDGRKFEMHVHKLNADGSKGELMRTIRLDKSNNWTATVGLPVGEYYIGEEQREGMSHTALTPFYTLTVTGEGKQTITVNQTTNATITNKYTRDAGSLTVEKVFAGDLDKTYFEGRTISVEVLSGNTVVKTLALNKDNNWTVTVTDLPAGDYTLREVTAEGANNTAYEKGYILSAVWTDGNAVQVVEDVPAKKTVTNTYTENKGTLIIGKEFAGDLTANDFAGKVIKFNVYEKGSTEAVATVEVTSPDWKTSVKLPVGEYTVEEAAGSGAVTNYAYTASWKNGDNEVKLVKNGSDEVTMVNTYTQDKGTLKISKSLTDAIKAMMPNATFTVKITADGATSPVATVTLKADGTVETVELPVGTYTLSEDTANIASPDNYTFAGVKFESNGAELTANQITITKDGEVTVTAVNTYTQDMGKLIISKNVEGVPLTLLPAGMEFTVKINAVEQTGATRFVRDVKIKANGEKVEVELPVGTYSLTEENSDAPAGYTFENVTFTGAAVVNGNSFTIAQKAAEVSVVVTNTYSQDKGMLKVTKKFAGVLDETDFANKSITVIVKNEDGDTAAELTLNQTGNWYDEAELPVGRYTLEETGAEMQHYGLVATMTNIVAGTINTIEIEDDLDCVVEITNTYTANPGTLTIRKELKGEAGGFPTGIDFIVKGENNYEKTVNVSAANNWTATITGIPVGQYTVTENCTVGNGYKLHTQWSDDPQSITIDAGGEVTITCINTYEGKISVTVPVQKTVKLGGNKTPGTMTFHYGVLLEAPANSDIILRYVNSTANTAGEMKKLASGGYAITVNDQGTVAGAIVIDGFASELNGVKIKTWELLSPYGDMQAAAADGWTYDQTAADSNMFWCVDLTSDGQVVTKKISLSTNNTAKDKVEFINIYTKNEEPVVPPTGDNGMPMLWLAMALLSVISLVIVKTRMKKQKN